jgi:hypothetical protein
VVRTYRDMIFEMATFMVAREQVTPSWFANYWPAQKRIVAVSPDIEQLEKVGQIIFSLRFPLAQPRIVNSELRFRPESR